MIVLTPKQWLQKDVRYTMEHSTAKQIDSLETTVTQPDGKAVSVDLAKNGNYDKYYNQLNVVEHWFGVDTGEDKLLVKENDGKEHVIVVDDEPIGRRFYDYGELKFPIQNE